MKNGAPDAAVDQEACARAGRAEGVRRLVHDRSWISESPVRASSLLNAVLEPPGVRVVEDRSWPTTIASVDGRVRSYPASGATYILRLTVDGMTMFAA